MLILDGIPEIASWNIRIIGTDISRQVLDYARRGRYRRLEINRGLPATMLLKHMTRDGEEWEVSARLRAMCDFQCANLCAPIQGLPVFDLVLLRNVLLYFSQYDRSAVFQNVHRHITHDGYLLLGNAEQADESTNLFSVEFSENENSYFYGPSIEK